jgi:DNA-binding MarR family transcriptional regulator
VKTARHKRNVYCYPAASPGIDALLTLLSARPSIFALIILIFPSHFFGLTIVVITSIISGMVTKLQEELKQVKPFASREEEVYLNILRTAELLSWRVVETLKRVELTPTQYNVLRILRGAGRAGASCSEISERMVTKDSDITRLLDRLEARKLISREREATDRRRITARITPGGLRLLTELDKPVQQCHCNQLGHLDEKQLETLSKLLEMVRKTLD